VFTSFSGTSIPIFVEGEPATVVERVRVGIGEVVLTQLREFLFLISFFENVRIDRINEEYCN